MMSARLATLCFSFVLIPLSACDRVEVDEFDEVEGLDFRSGNGGKEAPPPNEEESGGRGNGDWINNGLQDWNVSGLDVDYPLDSWMGLDDDEVDDDSDDDLHSEGWLADGDADESAIIHYIVECALAEGDSITKIVDGQPVILEGRLGLAPEWKTDACGEDCQQWVSACLMARRNTEGQVVNLWIEGDHPALGFGESPHYTHFEGVFFGNLFTSSTADDFACQGDSDGLALAQSRGRTCVLDDGACGLAVFETCASAGCDPSGTGIDAVDCQLDPEGPAYRAIAVHVSS